MIYQELILLVALVGVATALGCTGSQRPESQDQMLARVKSEVVVGDAILLDVREEDEWQEGHLQHARLVPTSKLNDESQQASVLEGLDTGKTIYTHCRRGGRAKAVAEMLQKMGYQVVPLEVAFETLVEAGFPTASN